MALAELPISNEHTLVDLPPSVEEGGHKIKKMDRRGLWMAPYMKDANVQFGPFNCFMLSNFNQSKISILHIFTFYLDAIKSSKKSYFKTENDLLILMDKDISKEMTNNILTLSCIGGRFTSAAIMFECVTVSIFGYFCPKL